MAERMIRSLIVGDSEIGFSLVRLPAYQETAKYVSSRFAILPFCHFVLKVFCRALCLRNLRKKDLSLKPETLGQHLKSRRLLRMLTQDQAAVK